MLYKCFLKFFHELYNKNNYLGVKKLFHFNLSILSVFLIFFKIIFKKSFILPLENDPSAIMRRKKVDEDIIEMEKMRDYNS